MLRLGGSLRRLWAGRRGWGFVGGWRGVVLRLLDLAGRCFLLVLCRVGGFQLGIRGLGRCRRVCLVGAGEIVSQRRECGNGASVRTPEVYIGSSRSTRGLISPLPPPGAALAIASVLRRVDIVVDLFVSGFDCCIASRSSGKIRVR